MLEDDVKTKDSVFQFLNINNDLKSKKTDFISVVQCWPNLHKTWLQYSEMTFFFN